VLPAAGRVIGWHLGTGRSGAGGPGAAHPGQTRAGRESTRSSVTSTRASASTLSGLRAKEHTAQVPPLDRQDREKDFSEAALPVLYCSPTMELGVDIKKPVRRRLAQRPAHSGELRAARWPRRKVGAARPRRHLLRHRQRARPVLYSAAPRRWSAGPSLRRGFDLANEDHHQVSRAGDLARRDRARTCTARLTELLDVAGEPRRSPAGGGSREAPGSGCDRPRHQTRDGSAQRAPARPGKRPLVAGRLDRGPPPPARPVAFDAACDRWRDLYRLARQEFDALVEESVDTSVPAQGTRARRPTGQRRPHPAQPCCPTRTPTTFQTDFYSYLPVTSPPRASCPATRSRGCPWRSYIPGLNGRREGDYIQRPPVRRPLPSSAPCAGDLPRGRRYQVVSVALPPSQPGKDRHGPPPRPAAAAAAATLHAEAGGHRHLRERGLRPAPRARQPRDLLRSDHGPRPATRPGYPPTRRSAGDPLRAADRLPASPSTARRQAGSTRRSVSDDQCGHPHPRLRSTQATTGRTTSAGSRHVSTPRCGLPDRRDTRAAGSRRTEGRGPRGRRPGGVIRRQAQAAGHPLRGGPQ